MTIFVVEYHLCTEIKPVLKLLEVKNYSCLLILDKSTLPPLYMLQISSVVFKLAPNIQGEFYTRIIYVLIPAQPLIEAIVETMTEDAGCHV